MSSTNYSYITSKTCVKVISYTIDDDNIVTNIQFKNGGCQGLLGALALTLNGSKAEDIIKKFENIDCHGKGTSCPAQLALALKKVIKNSSTFILKDDRSTKYQKKPIITEAMQFTEENKDIVYHWASEQQMNINPSFKDDKPVLIVPTLEGDMLCCIGDYLIKEPFPTDWRKFYPCKADIFEKTYDKIEE